MSKLPVISSRQLIKFLTKKKGFHYDHSTGSHHVLKSGDGKITVTIPERRDIGKGLLLAIFEVVGMTLDDFIHEWNK